MKRKEPPLRCVWRSMKRRCQNPKDKRFARYGGRGIKVCARWLDSFDAFAADMGVCPSGASLDRIDNDGNYEPGNCRWATKLEQTNNRSNSKLVVIDGIADSLAAHARNRGLLPASVHYRVLKLGMSPAEAVSVPLKMGNRKADLVAYGAGSATAATGHLERVRQRASGKPVSTDDLIPHYPQDDAQ